MIIHVHSNQQPIKTSIIIYHKVFFTPCGICIIFVRTHTCTHTHIQLFYRSISIISKLSRVSIEEAQEALLKAIYKEDDTDQVERERERVH